MGANGDFASHNLFAYCGNNPAIRMDVTGYLWKEAWHGLVDYFERIMAIQQQNQALDTQIRMQQNDMLHDAAKGLWDVYMRSVELQQQSQALDTQIRMQQNDIICDAAKSLWDVYMRGIELQQQSQLQNSMYLVEGFKYVTRDYISALGFVYATADMFGISTGLAIMLFSTNPIAAILGVLDVLFTSGSLFLYIIGSIPKD